MFELIRRLRTTVELLSAMESIRKDYHKILGLSLYLMLSNPIEISFFSLPNPYYTCKHSLQESLERAYSIPTPDYFQQEMFSKDSITIPDTLVSPSFELHVQLYNMKKNFFGLTEPVGTIGEAVSDWKTNKLNYERIQGIVIDTRYLMYHYTGNPLKCKVALANCIETVLKRLAVPPRSKK